MNQRRILVVYDGSEEADSALIHAAETARARGAAIGVVTVLPRLASAGGEAAAILREHALKGAVHTAIGDPATEIARVAQDHAYDEIHVGHRGSLARELQASVSSGVVRASDRTTVIAR